MNIRDALVDEHSIRQTNLIVDYIGIDPLRFRELIDIFLSGEYRLAQRAAWPLGICSQFHPELVDPHLRKLVDQLERDDVHDAVKRNVTRLLQYIEIPDGLRGRILDICFRLVDDSKEPVAVRVFAMTVVERIAHNEPDLLAELGIIVDKHSDTTTIAFRKRAEILLGRKFDSRT